MSDLRHRIDELSLIMEEYNLAEAVLSGEDWRVGFKKTQLVAVAGAPAAVEAVVDAPAAIVEDKPAGSPVSSPMNGIFYTSPSPNAPNFVKEGDSVTAGQVLGLIEAMKVFNEIAAPTSGTVTRIVAETGQLVQPGEPLMYIG